MPTTGSAKYPYPNASAIPDVPADVLLLAQRIDKMSSGWTVCADATARAALVTNGDAYEGLHVHQIDTGVTYVYKSMAWVLSGGAAWASYTPTITNWSSTGPTTTGRYVVSGGVCSVVVQSKLGTGSITVGAITVSLPVAAVTTGMILESTNLNGAVAFNDVTGTAGDTYGGLVRIVDANTVRPTREVTAGQFRAVASTAPFTWATLDEMSLAFSYPVA